MIGAFQYVRPTAQRPVGLTKESGMPFFGQTWPTDGNASFQFLQMYLFPQSGGFINVFSRRATGLWVTVGTEDIKICKNISDILRYRLMCHFLFLPHFDICDLLLNRHMATRNLFVNLSKMSGIFGIMEAPDKFLTSH